MRDLNPRPSRCDSDSVLFRVKPSYTQMSRNASPPAALPTNPELMMVIKVQRGTIISTPGCTPETNRHMPREEINYKLVSRLTREMRDAKNRPAKEYEVWDTKLEGFLLRVKPSGTVSYAMQYTRGKRITIGTVNEIEHTKAREEAERIRLQHKRAKRGEATDPVAERQCKEAERKQPNVEPQADTYLQFLDSTYRAWLRLNLKHGDYAYTTLVKAFPEFHGLALNEIGPGAIETWRTKRLESGLNPNTINRQLSDLKAALHRARDIWDLPISDKLDRVKPCKIDRSPKIRYLTQDEEAKLRKALDEREDDLRAGKLVYAIRKGGQFSHVQPAELQARAFADHLKPAVLVSLNTGLRRGELLKLRWENINFDKALVTVEGHTSKTGKTRHVPLNEEALTVLKKWKRDNSNLVYVFGGVDGEPLHDTRTSWETALKKAHISNFRWHDLRHTFASKLVMAGVDLNTVRELLGHSDYKMTLRYAHLAPEHKAAAVAKLTVAASAGA